MSGRITPPFPALHGGNCDDLSTAVEGDTIVMGSGGRFAPGAGGGGGGLTVGGTKAEGRVPTVEADDTTVSWADVTATDVANQGPVINVKDLRSGRRARGIATQGTGTIDVGADANLLTLAIATGWEVGNGMFIPGAGADHGLSTPTAPTVIPQTMGAPAILPATTTWESRATFTASTSTELITTSVPLAVANGTGIKMYVVRSVTFTANTSTELITTSATLSVPDGTGVRLSTISGTLPTHTAGTPFDSGTTYYIRQTTGTTWGLYPTAADAIANTNQYNIDGAGSGTLYIEAMPTYDDGTPAQPFIAGTTYYIRQATSTTWSLHPTSADAIANTNTYNIDGVGIGTLYFELVGSTTYEIQTAAASGMGGYTAASTAGSTSTGTDVLDDVTHLVVLQDTVANARSYAIYGTGTSGKRLLCVIPPIFNCRKIVADASGYTDLIPSDLGRTLVQGSHDGVIIAYDNATRTIWVEPTSCAADTFPGGSAVAWTITSGTGAGTQTAAATTAIYTRLRGTSTATPYKALGRRASAEMFVGELYLYPDTSSGNLFRVVEAFDTRTASSSGSPTLGTNLGDLSRDGDLVVRRENCLFPVTPPASAVYDGLFTYITALNGTEATLNDAATTSVTSATIFPDDTDACQAAHVAARAAGRASSTVYWPTGEYPHVTGKLVSGDSRWGTPTGGGSDQRALYDIAPGSGEVHGEIAWHFDARARLTWYPLDASSYITSGAGQGVGDFAIWRISRGKPVIRNAQIVLAHPFGTNCLEKGERNAGTGSGFNQDFFIIFNSSTNPPWISGPRVSNCEFHGFTQLTQMSADVAYGQDEVWENCYIASGGADGDNPIYTNGGLFKNCTMRGVRYTRSLCFYQDANDFTSPLRIEGGYYNNFRKNGLVRIRANGFVMNGGAVVEDCYRIFSSDSPDFVTVRDCRLYRTGIEPVGADRVTIDNVYLEDGGISIGSSNTVRISKTRGITQSGFTSSATTLLLNITGGSDIDISESKFEAQNSSANGAVRGLAITGSSGTIRISDSEFIGNGAWGVQVTSGFTGRLVTSGNLFKGAAGPEANQFAAGSAATWVSTNDTFSSTATGNETAFNGFGAAELVNPTIECKLSIESGITGPFIIRGGRSTSSTAATIGDVCTIIDHDFAVAPNAITIAGCYFRGNRIAGSQQQTLTAIAATANNYAGSVCDVWILTLTGNQSMTGILARAPGCAVLLINNDGADTLTLEHADAGSDAANRFQGTGAADVVAGPGAAVKLDWGNSLCYATLK